MASPLRLIPRPYIVLAIAMSIGLLCLSSYVAGRRAVQGNLDALKRSYELAAAQSQAARAERERVWTQAIKLAQERLSYANKTIVVERDAAMRGLREHGESARLRIASSPAPRDCSVGGPGYEEFLRKGEELEELVSTGARLSNALMACLASYPR